MRDSQRKSWTVSRFPVALRRTGIGFLRHPVPARDLGLCYLRLTGSA